VLFVNLVGCVVLFVNLVGCVVLFVNLIFVLFYSLAGFVTL